MKKQVIVPILLLVIAGLGYYAYDREESAASHGDITLYGNVDVRDVALGFRVSGRLQDLKVEEGDHVKKGDLLAVLDKSLMRDELAVREAELQQAAASLVNAEKTYARRARLVGSGAVSQGAFDDALASRDEAIAAVDTATARVRKAQTLLSDTEIHAPNDGVIMTRVHEPGAILDVGAPVYTLTLDNPVWVRAYIDEPNLGHIHPGMKATVKTDSQGHYTGKVGFISPQAEFTPKYVQTTQLRTALVYRIRIVIDEPNNGLRQGMPVTVEIPKQG